MNGPCLTRRWIYTSVIEDHLQQGFNPTLQGYGPQIVNATLDLFKLVNDAFAPTAAKFHYQFNMHELAAVCQVRFEGLSATRTSLLLSQKKSEVCCTVLCAGALSSGRSAPQHRVSLATLMGPWNGTRVCRPARGWQRFKQVPCISGCNCHETFREFISGDLFVDVVEA